MEGVKENIAMQLTEIEMLRSMYPSNDELKLMPPGILTEMQTFVDGVIDYEPSTALSCTLKILIAEIPVELEFDLPQSYPNGDYLRVFVRSPVLTKDVLDKANAQLREYIKNEIPLETLAVTLVVEWLQEFLPKINSVSKNVMKSEELPIKIETTSQVPEIYARIWILSHHIYSKEKRRLIQSCADEARDVSGFCLPGKPGIICYEGPAAEVELIWVRLRTLAWQKITLKEQETIEASERKFARQPFEEIVFKKERNETNSDRHMDLGEFFRYLQQHDLGYIFKDLFGFEGKSAE